MKETQYRIDYIYNHPYDATLDNEGSVYITTTTKDRALMIFHEEYDDQYKVQCVIDLHPPKDNKHLINYNIIPLED